MSVEAVAQEIKRSGEVFTTSDVLQDMRSAQSATEMAGLDLAGIQSMMARCVDEVSSAALRAVADCVEAQQLLAGKVQLALELLGGDTGQR